MAKLTERQRRIAANILQSGRISLSKETDDDYLAAADFIFENGLLYCREEALKALAAREGAE